MNFTQRNEAAISFKRSILANRKSNLYIDEFGIQRKNTNRRTIILQKHIETLASLPKNIAAFRCIFQNAIWEKNFALIQIPEPAQTWSQSLWLLVHLYIWQRRAFRSEGTWQGSLKASFNIVRLWCNIPCHSSQNSEGVSTFFFFFLWGGTAVDRQAEVLLFTWLVLIPSMFFTFTYLLQ